MLFAVAVVAGWSVYRAFENETGGGGARVSGPAPGAEAERVRTDGSGGLGRAVDGAREVLSRPESAGEPVPGRDGTIASGDDTPASGDGIAGPETVPPDQSGPPPRIANPPEYRTLLYAVRVDDGGEGSEAHHHVNITYDTVADDYFGVIGDTENGETEVVAFADEWRYSIGSDGIHRRVRRSPSSLRPEPDTPFADLLTETAVLPLPARPFARLVSEEPTGEVGIDGTNTTVYSYVVDTEAFRTADPGASAQWRAMWAAGAHDDADLIVPGTEQVQLREVTGFELPDNHAPFTVPDVDVTPLAGQMGVVFRVTDRGVVDRVVLRSPDDGVRIQYIASEYHDEPATLLFSQEAWVEAP